MNQRTMPGMRCRTLTPRIRLTSICATLGDDKVIRGQFPAHFSLVLMREGAGTFQLNEQKIQHYGANRLLISCSAQPCSGFDFFPRNHFYDLLIVDFDPALLNTLYAAALPLAEDGGRVFSAPLSEPLQEVMRLMLLEWQDDSALGTLRLEGLALNALWEALRGLDESGKGASPARELQSRDRKRLIDARDYVRERATHVRSMGEIAQVCGLSLMALKRGFPAMFGVTLWSYVITQRLEHARELLREELTLQDIASQSGFSHASHLSRFFRQHYGMTPGDYRKTRTHATG